MANLLNHLDRAQQGCQIGDAIGLNRPGIGLAKSFYWHRAYFLIAEQLMMVSLRQQPTRQFAQHDI